MKREYKGQEGFFYKSGNKKLRQDVGIINSARRMKEGLESSYLALLITKENGHSTVFAVDSPYDVLDVMCELGVNKPSEVARLSEEKRKVVMYCEPNRGMNYGFCFADKYKMPASLRRKLGEVNDGKVYVGKPSPLCLALAKEFKYMPGVSGQKRRVDCGYIK